MAQNYQQFSTTVDYTTEEQRQWLSVELSKENEDGYTPNEYQDCKKENDPIGYFWVYAEESGDIERLAEIVSDYQQKFNLLGEWILRWACWCSKLRVDEFSGGAVAVYKGKVKWIDPYTIARKWIDKQTPKKK